jgi:hypothetical protein
MIIYAYGKNGAILNVGTMSKLCKANNFPPQVELRLDALLEGFPRISQGFENLRVRIDEAYRLHQKFGPWGDLMSVSHDGPYPRFDWIAPLAYPKPTLAADLIPFIRDSEGRLFWIGIKRGRPPGEGKLALIGGIRAIEKRELSAGPTYMLETPLENLMHESEEEAGIFLSNLLLVHAAPYTTHARVDVNIPELGISSAVAIRNVNILRTDIEAERDPLTGQLRVHETTGYVFVVHVDRPLLASEIEAALHPTDKQERTTPVVRQIGSFVDMRDIQLSFHSVHHCELFSESMALCIDALYCPRPILKQ